MSKCKCRIKTESVTLGANAMVYSVTGPLFTNVFMAHKPCRHIPLHRQSQYQQTLPWVSGWVSHQLEMEGGKSAPIVRAPVFMRIQIILWDNVREPDGEACDIEIKLETTPTCFNNMLSRFFYSYLVPCFVKFHSKG